MVNQIYPPEQQLNKAIISDTEAPLLYLHLSVSKRFVSSKIYDKRDDFDFDIVNFPVLDGDVELPRRASYGVYISQLMRFARVCNHVTDFNARNNFSNRAIGIINFEKPFQFRKIITRYRRTGYNLNVMRQSACLVFNPITVDNYAAFFNCTPVGRASDSMMAPT